MNNSSWIRPLSLTVMTALLLLANSTSQADVITDFRGLEVGINVETTGDGGRDFYAELLGESTAVIGDGAEFTLRLTSGDFGGGSNENFLDIDFDTYGNATAIARESFYYGSFYYPDSASFRIDIGMTDPNVEITSATTSGGMPAGSHSQTGLAPVEWSFQTEFVYTNSSNVIAFNPASPGPVPVLSLGARAVPEPTSTAMLVSLAIACLAVRRRN